VVFFSDATENSQKAITGIPLNGNFEVKDEPRDLYVPDLNLQNETKNILFSNGHFLDVTETSQKAIIGSPANGNFRVKEEPKDFYVSDVNLIKQFKSIKSPSGHFSELGIGLIKFKESNKNDGSWVFHRDEHSFLNFPVNARKQNNRTQDDNNISKLQDLLLKELQDQPAKSDNRRKLACSHCKKIFSTWYALHQHVKKHNATKGNFVCPHCERRFVTKNGLQKHVEKHNTTKVNARKQNNCTQDDNKLLDQPARSDNRRKFACPHCERRFVTKYALHKHVTNHKTTREHTRARQKRNYTLKCQVCPKMFHSNSALVEHMRSHTGERPFQCPKCDMSFSYSSCLKSHLRTIHVDEKRHKCATCGSKFKLARYLANHVKKCHAGRDDGVKYEFECHICEKRFVKEKSLITHVKQCHKAIPKPELKRQVEPESKIQVEPESKIQVEPESKIQNEPESKIQNEPESKIQVEAELNCQVEPELVHHMSFHNYSRKTWHFHSHDKFSK